MNTIYSSLLKGLHLGKKPALAAAMVLLASQSFAGINQFSIGLNLGSDGGNNAGTGSLNPTDVAGLPAVAQANWNNLPGVSGSTVNVTDNTGNPTSAGAVWFSGAGTWSSQGNNFFTSTTDHTLMQGYLDNGGTATVTITNIPSQLTTSGYDVYVYALFDTPNRGGTYQIFDGLNTSTAITALLPLNSDSGATNYAQAVGTGSIKTGNYLVFHGLTNANIQLQAVATNLVGTIRAVICGVQLVAAPGPGESGAATGLNVNTNGQVGQLLISWTAGAGSSGSLVVLRPNVPETAQPVDGVVYNGNPTFGSGDNLGDDEIGNANYAVYAGASSSVVVSNLTPTLTYYAAVYPYNGAGASINYTLAKVATGSATVAGSPTNIVLSLPSPLIAGSARNFQVLAQFANGAVQNVAASSTVTSSNNAIISILGPGRLGAIASGSVGLKAVYSGFTNIQIVTVSPMSMTYDWSFNEAAANLTVTDSVQQAVGYVTNNPFSGPDGSGHLVLDGAGGFVALPPDLLSNYGGLTIELWATETTAGNWARLWDFGSGQTINMFMTPVAGGPTLRTAFTVGGGGAEQRVNYPFSVDTALHQYVFTLSGATTTGKIFLDGVQVGTTTNFTFTPEDLGPMPNVYIGKSQYPDPLFTGSFDEFRIYNGPLSATQIALDAATGPDVITSNPGALTSLTVSGSSPIPQFGIEQLSVTGIFANVSNPVSITTVEGIRYFTSDPNIGTVDGVGVFTATGPGTVTIRATLLGSGITNSVAITVNAIPPGMTHRWPFNTDFNDLLGAVPAVAHGTVNLDGLGNAVLDGQGAAGNTSGSYIELPANVLLGYSSIALEAWYTDADGDGTGVNRNWARIWDFGSGPGINLFLTPFVGGEVDTMRLALNTNNNAEVTLNCPRPLTNVEHHIVFVLDATNRLATLWVDGVLASYNRNFVTRPRDMGPNPNDWLGRSQYGDPLFVGLIDEFRIYNGTIDPLQIGIDYATGPNNLVQNPGALSTVSMSLTTNMVAGNPQKATALATFASVANVPVTALATNWTSSDPTVARVDQNGLVTAIGPGSALISSTFRGVTGSATVNVSATPVPILSHRYSFDAGDARDTGVVGGGDGTVTGTPTFANGMVTIADVNSYIALPGHLFDSNLEVTLETWCVVAANSGSGARMCDFGTSVTGPSSFALTPTANGNNFVAFRTSPNTAIGLPVIDSWGRAAFGTTNHYAFVVSDIKRRVDIYLNGQLKDSFPYDNSLPGTLQSGNVQYRYMLSYLTNNMTEGWFGKNVGGTTGAGWFGSIDEFRIWNGPLDKLQVQVSFLKGPGTPSIDPGAIQSLSVALSDTSMVLGSIQRPSVSGVFANVAQSLDLTALSGVVFTSSDSTKVAVINGGDTKLQAVGVGSANIVASYAGKSVTNSVTVIAKPPAVVTHRYSFRGNMSDSVGHANGRLFGNATIAGGKLVLDGTLHPPTYARLPNDLISGYDQLTIEAFYSASAGASGSQQRLWDFGDHIVASGGITGTAYLYEAAGRGAAGLPSNSPFGEASVITPTSNQSQFTTNTTCVAATIDSLNQIMNIYTNGVFAASITNFGVNLNLVVDNFSFLGRSQWADPHFAGSIDDFRVYYGVLTPAQVAASFAAGPDPDKLSATISAPGQTTISWPATLVTAGYSLQSSSSLTSGIWSNVGGFTQVGNNYQVTVNSAGAPVFFRLIK